jgi:hypothetical protein
MLRCIPKFAVKKILITRTTDALLGEDIKFPPPTITIKPKAGTPNWHAAIRVDITTYFPQVYEAFQLAVTQTQSEYDVDWALSEA